MIIFFWYMIFVKICGNIKIVRFFIKESLLKKFFIVGYVYMEELVLWELIIFWYWLCLFENVMCLCLDIYICK